MNFTRIIDFLWITLTWCQNFEIDAMIISDIRWDHIVSLTLSSLKLESKFVLFSLVLFSSVNFQSVNSQFVLSFNSVLFQSALFNTVDVKTMIVDCEKLLNNEIDAFRIETIDLLWIDRVKKKLDMNSWVQFANLNIANSVECCKVEFKLS